MDLACRLSLGVQADIEYLDAGDAATVEKKNTQVKEELEAKGRAAEEEKDPSASAPKAERSVSSVRAGTSTQRCSR